MIVKLNDLMFEKYKLFIKKTALYLVVLIPLVGFFYYSVMISRSIECTNGEVVDIPKGASLSYVVNEVRECECFPNPSFFKYAVILNNKQKKIRPGYYQLSEVKSVSDFIDLITSPIREMKNITILEGWSLDEIKREFYTIFEIDTLIFHDLCHNENFISSLGIKAVSLEGYLYPDTYSFSADLPMSSTKEVDVIITLVSEFKEKFSEAINSKEISYSMHEIVTLASIIQGECVYSDEMYTVSSVYNNRLNKGWKLQADPTIQYIIPGKNKRLYNKDYFRHDSPYNTYLYKGLPPGPINSPGIHAIKAAAYPEKTDYMFFVAKGNNRHHFSKTEREHINAKNKFLKKVW